MLNAILCLAAICIASAAAVFGHAIPMSSSLAGLCLVVLAIAGTLLIGSVEAFETEGVRPDRDERSSDLA